MLETYDVEAQIAAVNMRWRSRGEQLFPYQEDGARWLAEPVQAKLLGDSPGCIDGDAIVRLNRAGKGFALSLRELHRKFHGGTTNGQRWDARFPTMIRSMCDGEFRLNRVVDVVDQGVREVVKLTLASGKTLRLTPDHEVAFPVSGDDGRLGFGFTRIDAFHENDLVATNGQSICSECGKPGPVVTYAYAKFRGVCRTCVYRKKRLKWNRKEGGRSLDKDGYVMVSGQYDHPAARGSAYMVREHVLVMEKRLGRYLLPGEIVHHDNEKKDDNRDENLVLTTNPEHATIHGKDGGYRHMNGGRGGKGGEVVFIPKPDAITSIAPDGEAHVYDVVCADPHRNFVANGVVVHNCGKTPQVVVATPPRAPVLVVCPATVKFPWGKTYRFLRPEFGVRVINGKADWRMPHPSQVAISGFEILPPTNKELCDAIRVVADRVAMKVPGGDSWDVDTRERVLKQLIAVGAPRAAPGEWGETVRIQHARRVLTLPHEGTTLVVDEAHRASHPETNTSRRVAQIARLVLSRGGRLWLLTGTPMRNNLDELWTVLQLGGMGARAFRPSPTASALEARGQFDIDALFPGRVAEKLKGVMLRRELDDPAVAPFRKKPIVDTIEVTLDAETKALADRVVDLLRADGIDLETATLAAINTATLKKIPREMMAELRAKLATAKIPAMLDLVADLEDSGVPVAVFCDHLNALKHLVRRPGWSKLTGDESLEEKQAAIEAISRPDGRGIALSTRAAGVGTDGIQRRVWRGIFVDLPWVPADLEQSMGRLDRLRQNVQPYFTKLVADHVLERKVAEKLETKQKLFDETIRAAAVPARRA